MTASSNRQPGRDAPAEIDRHNFSVQAITHDFVINPRFRREIEAAIRQGPVAVFGLLDEIAYEQDLDDAIAMIEGVADSPRPDSAVLSQLLGNALALIEGVRKAMADGSRRRGS
jgi:hypothetical protein